MPSRYDVFISHASEDKASVAQPLAAALAARGVRVWLDAFELTVGDSLRRSIDRGLSESRFGIVILSRDFFRKEWPNKELDGLVAREDGRAKVILPVWHGVTRDDVGAFSVILADKLAANTSAGIEAVAHGIHAAMMRDQSAPAGAAAAPTATALPPPPPPLPPPPSSVADIRRRLFEARGPGELQRLLFAIEAHLASQPWDAEGRELRQSIERAMDSERRLAQPPVSSRPGASASASRGTPVAHYAVAGLAMMLFATLGWQFLERGETADAPVSKPTAPTAVPPASSASGAPQPAAPAACRHPANGIERWGQEQSIPFDSGWRHGGSSPQAYCADRVQQRRTQYPDRDVSIVGVPGEQSKEEFFRQFYYRYTCTVQERWAPVYRLAPNAACQ